MNRFFIKLNGKETEIGEYYKLEACISIARKLNLKKKEAKVLYNNGEITLKDGTFIEVYKK